MPQAEIMLIFDCPNCANIEQSMLTEMNIPTIEIIPKEAIAEYINDQDIYREYNSNIKNETIYQEGDYMTLALVKDEDIRYNKRKNEIKCRLCKGSDTRISSDSEPIWIRDRNIRGDWTGQFLCYQCYYKRDKICHECGTEQIIESVRMFRQYNRDTWTGKFICRDCYGRKNIDYKNRNIILKIGEGGGSLLDIVVSTVLEVPTYSIYIADKRLPFGIIHEDHGIVGIKASKLRYNCWYFNINDYISADTYFLIGLDKGLKNINAMYIVPTEERKNNGRFSIYENSKKYDDLKIDHECYNEVYKDLINRPTESNK